MRIGIVDCVLHSRDFFGVFVRNFNSELIFQSHHQLHDVQGIGAEIVDVGMIVALDTGLFVEAGPAQLLSSAKITTKYKSDPVCLSSARQFFIDEIVWKRV